MNYLHHCILILHVLFFFIILYLLHLPFPQAVQINCQTSACQKKKKKSLPFYWKINWVISVTGKLPALIKVGGEGTQILTAID